MNLPMPPLDDEELAELDRFLLYRGNEAADGSYVEGRDEGILTVSELDGFLAAVVSGPQQIAPSRWLPAVWGDVEPAWPSTQAFERILTLLSRHRNAIVTALFDTDEQYQPLFMEREVNGKRHTIVHEWCRGYLRGICLAPEQWQGDEMLGLLMPIDIFTNAWGWRILENLNAQENAILKQEIGPAARAIHSYWRARRRRTS